MNNRLITIDGSIGEGGGQILRTALSLSLITGTPCLIQNIRQKRSKPGLLRQHLAAVQAAKDISNAEVRGDVVSSTELHFSPGKVAAGAYSFSIGTAGSTVLVAQTILFPLLFSKAPSTVKISGGTHNPFAPPYHFFHETYLPQLHNLGIDCEAHLTSYGFYPAGGGELTLSIQPLESLQSNSLIERGETRELSAQAFVSNLPLKIAKRELEQIRTSLNIPRDQCFARELKETPGPGNIAMVFVKSENVTETFSEVGRKGLSAEHVGKRCALAAQKYLESPAAVGSFLADQLLLPYALAGAGSFTTLAPSNHTRTNARIIEMFLDVSFRFTEDKKSCLVEIDS